MGDLVQGDFIRWIMSWGILSASALSGSPRNENNFSFDESPRNSYPICTISPHYRKSFIAEQGSFCHKHGKLNYIFLGLTS